MIMEMESEEKTISVTPCTSFARRNLLSKFENSEDSGVFSITPGSREQSYKVINDHSFNASNGNYFTTPSSDIEVLPMTPDIGGSNNFCPLSEGFSDHNRSSIKDNEEIMDLCYGPVGNDVFGRENFHCSSDETNNESVYMDCEEESFSFGIPGDLPKPANILNESVHVSEGSSFTLINKPIESGSSIQSGCFTLPVQGTPKKLKSPKRRKISKSKLSFKRRSLYGFECIDILYFLGQKGNFTGVISKILSYLSIKDLLNVCLVSKTWLKICYNDPEAKEQLDLYKERCAVSKENYYMKPKKERKKNGARVLLSNIQNIQEVSPVKLSSPAASPRTKRFQQFCKKGEKMSKESKLMICPQCRSPVCCNNAENNRGQCEKCFYEFCTICLSNFHFPNRCYRISSLPSLYSRTRKDMIIGSKESKRRLSRT